MVSHVAGDSVLIVVDAGYNLRNRTTSYIRLFHAGGRSTCPTKQVNIVKIHVILLMQFRKVMQENDRLE